MTRLILGEKKNQRIPWTYTLITPALWFILLPHFFGSKVNPIETSSCSWPAADDTLLLGKKANQHFSTTSSSTSWNSSTVQVPWQVHYTFCRWWEYSNNNSTTFYDVPTPHSRSCLDFAPVLNFNYCIWSCSQMTDQLRFSLPLALQIAVLIWQRFYLGLSQGLIRRLNMSVGEQRIPRKVPRKEVVMNHRRLVIIWIVDKRNKR